MFVKVSRLSQEERPKSLREIWSIVCASGFRSPFEIAALQQKNFHLRGTRISIITSVIILKQLFAEGKVNIHQYSQAFGE